MTPFLQEHSTRTGPVWSDIIIVIHKFVQLRWPNTVLAVYEYMSFAKL